MGEKIMDANIKRRMGLKKSALALTITRGDNKVSGCLQAVQFGPSPNRGLDLSRQDGRRQRVGLNPD